MTYILPVAGEATLFVASFAVQFLLMLAFRNPFRGAFFRSTRSEISAAVFMAALLCISFGLMISGLIDAGLPVSYSVAIGAVLGVAVPMILWRLMKMRVRLDAADIGSSPFALTADLSRGSAARDTVR